MHPDDVAWIRPEAEQMIGFVKVLEGESTMTVTWEEWGAYIDAWWKFQDATRMIQERMKVSRPGEVPVQPFQEEEN